MHVRHQNFPFGSVKRTYTCHFLDIVCMLFLTSLQYWGFQIIMIHDTWKNVYVHSATLHATMVDVANTCTTKQWFLSGNYGKPTTTFTLLLNIRSEYRHCSHWLMIHQSNATTFTCIPPPPPLPLPLPLPLPPPPLPLPQCKLQYLHVVCVQVLPEKDHQRKLQRVANHYKCRSSVCVS